MEMGKRSHFRTRVGMNFDPRATRLHSLADVDEFLARYCVRLSHGIMVEFCPQDEFVKSSSNGGVYLYPRILGTEAVADEGCPQRSDLLKDRPPVVGGCLMCHARVPRLSGVA